ncbi:hypothetical protein GKS22_02155 [Streptococcus uberis]|uniref:hypothetical protein n=1 Tax=Streptococcus uberis TaxID=1349 RepID=UPI0012B5DDA9|nr:hypothetical protein [Streptococcus uberis]MTB42538.1 hypothetical protein [Streptococcus uberis]
MKLKDLKPFIYEHAEPTYYINDEIVYLKDENRLVNDDMEIIYISAGNCEELIINLRP